MLESAPVLTRVTRIRMNNQEKKLQHDDCMRRFIELANEMKNDGVGVEVVDEAEERPRRIAIGEPTQELVGHGAGILLQATEAAASSM